MPKVEIKYHRYMCHPETCNHDDHYSWWVVNKTNDNVLGRFDTKNGAIKFCEENEIKYIVKLPQWSDY